MDFEPLEVIQDDPYASHKEYINDVINYRTVNSEVDCSLVNSLLKDQVKVLNQENNYAYELTKQQLDRGERQIGGIINLVQYIENDINDDPLLRDYQKPIFRDLVEYIKNPPLLKDPEFLKTHTPFSAISGALKLPPGYGKTYIVKRLMDITGWRMGYLVNATVVRKQTVDIFDNPENAYLTYSGAYHIYTDAARKENMDALKNVDIMVLDEAHHLTGESYENILLLHEIERSGAIFLSATPSYKFRQSLFKLKHRQVDLISERTIQQAIEVDGALSTTTAHVLRIKRSEDVEEEFVDSEDTEDYNSVKLSAYIRQSGAMHVVADAVKRDLDNGAKVMINCELIDDVKDQSRILNEQYNDKDIHCLPIYADMDKDVGYFTEHYKNFVEFAKDKKMSLFEAANLVYRLGYIKSVAQIKTMREGFSDTEVDTVYNLAPTRSAVNAEQRLRNMRIGDNTDKVARVVDIVYEGLFGSQVLASRVLGKSILVNRNFKQEVDPFIDFRGEHDRRLSPEDPDLPEYEILTETEQVAFLKRYKFFESQIRPHVFTISREKDLNYIDAGGIEVPDEYIGLRVMVDRSSGGQAVTYFSDDSIIYFNELYGGLSSTILDSIHNGSPLRDIETIGELLKIEYMILKSGYMYQGGFDHGKGVFRPIIIPQDEIKRGIPFDSVKISPERHFATTKYLLAKLLSTSDGIVFSIDLEPTLNYQSAVLTINRNAPPGYQVFPLLFGRRTIGYYLEGYVSEKFAHTRGFERLARQNQIIGYEGKVEGLDIQRKFVPAAVYEIGLQSNDKHARAWQIVFDDPTIKPFQTLSPMRVEILSRFLYEGSLTYWEVTEIATKHMSEYALSAATSFNNVLVDLNANLADKGVMIKSDKKTGFYLEITGEKSIISLNDVEKSRKTLDRKVLAWVEDYIESYGIPNAFKFKGGSVGIIEPEDTGDGLPKNAIVVLANQEGRVNNYYVVRDAQLKFWKQLLRNGGYIDDSIAISVSKLYSMVSNFQEIKVSRSQGFVLNGDETYRMRHLEAQFKRIEYIDKNTVKTFKFAYISPVHTDTLIIDPPTCRFLKVEDIDQLDRRRMNFYKKTYGIMEYTIYNIEGDPLTIYVELEESHFNLFNDDIILDIEGNNFLPSSGKRTIIPGAFGYIKGGGEESLSPKERDNRRSQFGRLNDSILQSLIDSGVNPELLEMASTRRVWLPPRFKIENDGHNE